MTTDKELTEQEREDIAEILGRRANEIASFLMDYTKDEKHFGCAEHALSREISRLRLLAERVRAAAMSAGEDQ